MWPLPDSKTSEEERFHLTRHPVWWTLKDEKGSRKSVCQVATRLVDIMTTENPLDAPKMVISSRTPEGWPNKCPICGNDLRIEPSPRTLDAPCPKCGHLLWFAPSGEVVPVLNASRSRFESSPTDLADLEIPDYVIELLPQSVALENRVLPLAETQDSLVVAVADPSDIETIEKLRFILNRKIGVIHVPEEWLRDQLRQHYGDDASDGPS